MHVSICSHTPCVVHLFLGRTASCFNCSNLTPTHIGPQKDELLLPASFLPVTIKYVLDKTTGICDRPNSARETIGEHHIWKLS